MPPAPGATMAHQAQGGKTELTGRLEERSGLFGVLTQIEPFGLGSLELLQIPTGPKSP